MTKKPTKPAKRDYQQVARGILDQIAPDAEPPKPPAKKKAKKKAAPKK